MPTATIASAATAQARNEPANTQMNTRINSALKTQGDAVLARNGLTPSQAVRSLWEYMATHDDLPDYLKQRQAKAGEEAQARRRAAVERASGLLGRLVVERGLMTQEEWGRYEGSAGTQDIEAYYDQLKAEAYDEKAEEAEREWGRHHGK